MARKRHSDEDILRLLREIELHLVSGSDVSTACRKAGVSDATYYNWCKKFGGMGRSQLSGMKLSTPERFCSSWPEQKCSSDASKKAPRYRGAFLLVASHSSVVGAGGGLDLVRRNRLLL